MTYNVRYFGHATRGVVSTPAAMRRIAASIAALDPLPDLVCLQEVETRSLRSNAVVPVGSEEETQLDRLMRDLEQALAERGSRTQYTAYYFPAHRYRITERANIYTTGLAVLAHGDFTIDHHNATRPADITHRRVVKNLKQTRICAHVAFQHRSGHTIDVFNTHFSLPSVLSRAFWTEEARMGFGPNQLEEAKALGKLVREERRGEQFIVVGDFNSLPGSPVDTYIQEELGLVDAFRAVSGMSPEEARSFATAGFLNLRMHLDHVYSSPALEWLDFDDTHAFGKRGRFAGLSDHVPLIGRCRVRDGMARTRRG
jgi:endonuclease/exonuclease/phosphatase family metal-dependent hydrolase